MAGKDFGEEFDEEFARKAAMRRLVKVGASLLGPVGIVIEFIASAISPGGEDPPPPDCGQGALVRR